MIKILLVILALLLICIQTGAYVDGPEDCAEIYGREPGEPPPPEYIWDTCLPEKVYLPQVGIEGFR